MQKDKAKLLENATKKIKTTMIGALAILEEQLEKGVYNHEEVRNKILDLGNKQIKNLQREFEQYSITWNRFQYKTDMTGRLYRIKNED